MIKDRKNGWQCGFNQSDWDVVGTVIIGMGLLNGFKELIWCNMGKKEVIRIKGREHRSQTGRGRCECKRTGDKVSVEVISRNGIGLRLGCITNGQFSKNSPRSLGIGRVG